MNRPDLPWGQYSETWARVAWGLDDEDPIDLIVGMAVDGIPSHVAVPEGNRPYVDEMRHLGWMVHTYEVSHA